MSSPDPEKKDDASQASTGAPSSATTGSGPRSEDDTATTTLPRTSAAPADTEQTTVMRYPDADRDRSTARTTGTGTGAGSTGAATGGATTAAPEDRASARAAARAERERALGVRNHPAPVEEEVDPGPTKHNTDRFLGSLGLFLLRLVTAAVMGVHGAQKLLDIDGTTQFFTSTALPYPEVFALVTAIGEVLIALALLLGLLVRVAGLGVLAISVGALVLVHWYRNPFVAGQSGFQGELELVLAGVGLLLACVGGGWWGIDAALRRGRARRRAGV
ncbi:DoxX family membrane protein [Auraticoccus sp. F435]|uniref:DoxX family membrane protein n=1 Tax=Auraticoccus cholistanensis TaxID=2656650 RepID=A0A6A9V1E0_9ACTN|nr:DoxX family protein [Auraticoccus cholistanensis]MVA76950.1 DoxX family membrane protein [Auraticoccus cholistanensis]